MKVSRKDTIDRYYLFSFLGFGIFIHRIHHDDPVGIYHSHPWNGFSLIFGRYFETILGQPERLKRYFNLIVAKNHHRVRLADSKPVWTLFFHLRRSNDWSVKNDAGEILSTNAWRGVDDTKSSYV